MISIFFRCACPYVGYTLKRADLSSRTMCSCTPAELTHTGHKALHSSGSYLLLGTFEGKKYFHIRQSKSSVLDEQGRQIYTNVALLGTTPADAAMIHRIAGYALLNEDGFYREIAPMVHLLEGDFTVDFDALTAFLRRFTQDYTVNTTNSYAKQFVKDVVFSSTRQEIDFIVTEANWSYFLKQVGIHFPTPSYCFDQKDVQALSQTVDIVFPEPTPANITVQQHKQVQPEEKQNPPSSAKTPAPASPTPSAKTPAPASPTPSSKPSAPVPPPPSPEPDSQPRKTEKQDQDTVRKLEEEKDALRAECDTLRQRLTEEQERILDLNASAEEAKRNGLKQFLTGVLSGTLGTLIVFFILNYR